jgi:hypothetical protein
MLLTEKLRVLLQGSVRRCRATCTIEAASFCILQTQPRSGGVGAFDGAPLLSFVSQSKVRGRLLLTGRLGVFRSRLL